MRKLLVLTLLAFATAAVADDVMTAEKLVLASAATKVDINNATRKGIELYNHGPNPIWCAQVTSSLAVVNKSRKIAAEGTWSLMLNPGVHIYCKAETADQVTGAATIVNEVR